jgi:hypothetical protein
MSRRERISDFTRPVAREYDRSVRREQELNHERYDSSFKFSSRTEPQKSAKLRSSKQDVVRNGPKDPPAFPKQDRSRVLRRDGLKKLPEFKPKKKQNKFKYKTIASALTVILLVIVTPVLIFNNFNQTKGAVKGVKSLISGVDDEPKYLISSSIMDVPAKIEPIDSIDDVQRSLTDYNKLGWYNKSSKSGQKGAMVFTGYVSSPNNIGALREITAMKTGDYIQVETGDGRFLVFIVKEIRKIQPNELNYADISKSIDPNKEGLNIISYTDSVDSNPELTNNRYIVYSVKE